MDSSPALPLQVEQALARGWTVLTTNQRAARTLRHDFDRSRRALGEVYWQPPSILAWDSWLASLWHRLLLGGHASELLLNPAQEHTIWRAIIAADSATASLRPVDSLAQTAADAWLLLNAYRGRSRLGNFAGNSDTRVFARWVAEFERRCKRAQYLTQAQLAETLRVAVAAAHVVVPHGLLLVGDFNAHPPAQAALLDALRAAGSEVEELDPQSSGAASTSVTSGRILVAAPDEYAELTACARWLRSRLTEQPASRLAVIVPALATWRSKIDRVFRQVLAPELGDIAAPAGAAPFEFSLGIPLASTPMVATALDLLHWLTAPLALDRVSALLLSPYFAADAADEYLARAEFDAFVLRRRHLLQPRISFEALATLVSQSQLRSRLPILLDCLRALRPLGNQRDLANAERTHADWAATIHELLEAAGWAPAAQLDSIEFQTRRKWESALDELATLDFDGVRVPSAAALAALERIAAGTLFAPESRRAPVQIMGPLESAGSTFDAIWFLHAGDLAWPTKPATNPLLPWLLQRELAMPGANSAVDSERARHITGRIAVSASTVLLSFAQESADGRQRPSPVVVNLNPDRRNSSAIAPTEPDPAAIELEAVADDAPISAPSGDTLQGGAAILQAQAACGFRAFAEKRLFSSALESTSLGLDPRERGSLVHKVLEKFWAGVKTQAELQRMTFAERNAQLALSIDAAISDQNPHPESGWSDAYLDAERQRLLNLLHPWLNYELTRSPFAVKSQEEIRNDVQIGPLHLDIRVDRIDTALLDGKPAGDIILDYKTGAASPADWLGDRPDEPQLPLYAVVAEGGSLAAVAFASLRPGTKNLGLKGYESRPGVLPKASKLKTESLKAQVDQWRAVLTSLAHDFHSGDARVSPKSYPKICEYCDQRLLCRLDPSTLDANALDETDADAGLLASSGLEEDRG